MRYGAIFCQITTQTSLISARAKTPIVYGLLPEATAFAGQTVGDQLAILASPDMPLTFEINGRAVSAVGSFKLGTGFSADGALFVLDQTF